MKQAGLLALWLAVLVALLAWYVDTQKSLAVAEAIGRIVKTQGKVLFQSEQLPTWNVAVDGQDVFDGNTISTRTKSSVEVSLASGKTFEIGPESQVKLSAALSLLKPDFMVNVLVGNLKVKQNAPRTGSPLVRNFASFGLRALGQKETTRIRVGDKVIEVAEASAPARPGPEGTPVALLDLMRGLDGKLQVKSDPALQLMVRDEVTGEETSAQGRMDVEEDGGEDDSQGQDAAAPVLSTSWASERIAESALEKAILEGEFASRVLWHVSSLRQGRVEAVSLVFSVPPEHLEDLSRAVVLARVVPDVASVGRGGEGVTKRLTVDEKGMRITLAPQDLVILARADAGRRGLKGLFSLRVQLGARVAEAPENEVAWARRSYMVTLASVADMEFARMRVLLGEATWESVRSHFQGARTTPTPRWFWQGSASSQALREPGGAQRLAWKFSFDFADKQDGLRFASLLRSGAEFQIAAAQDGQSDNETALRIASDGAWRVVVRGMADSLEAEFKGASTRGFLKWSEGRVAWLGRADQGVLEPSAFFPRLERARAEGSGAAFPWPSGSTGFRMARGARDTVVIEWAVALGHPLFARSLLGESSAFLPLDSPRAWLVGDSGGVTP
jgi:hypothetical protein